MIFGTIMTIAGLIGLILFGLAGMTYLAVMLGVLPIGIGLWRFKQLHDLKRQRVD